IDRLLPLQVRAADELIERRQRGGQLRDAAWRQERRAAAGVRGVAEAEALLQGGHERVHLPAGRTMHQRHAPEDLRELIARQQQLAPCPRLARPRDSVLPAYVIPGVHPDLEAALRDVAHGL